MPTRLACLIAAGVAAASVMHGLAQTSPPPTAIPQTKFDAGQSVVPVYEGWIRNPDGTFDLVFGYFNRNYKEELVIPPGPNNDVEPGGPDRGQPTYFLPRRQPRLFRVRVPADFGQQTLVWTLTVSGRPEKAYATLLPVEEINEKIIASGGNSVPFGDDDPNKPPTISVAPVSRATPASPVTLTATVADDGLPKPRPAPARTATTAGGRIDRQLNTTGPARPRGLTVRWFEYRGPAKVAFEPDEAIPVAGGAATVTARFAAPGTYTLVAIANDGQLSQRTTVTVTVTP